MARPPGNPGEDGEAQRGHGRARLLPRSDQVDLSLQVRVHVTAGPKDVTAALLQRSRAADPRKMQPYRSSFDTYDATGVPHIETVVVKGPFKVDSPGDTPSRARVFSVPPEDAGAGRAVRATDPHDAGAPRLPAAGGAR